MNQNQENAWRRNLEALWQKQGLACADDAKFCAGIDRLLILGSGTYERLIAHCSSLFEAWQQGRLSVRAPEPVWSAELRQLTEGVVDASIFGEKLRHFFDARQLEIIWLDMVERAAPDLVTQRHTRLAETCLRAATEHLTEVMTLEFGVPQDAAGKRQHLIVLGLGRFGGQELTVFGPLKLMLAFTGHGQTNAMPGVNNERFFQTLSERLVDLLNQSAASSDALHVDLGLRPRGDAGPICLSADAFEHFFETEGRAHHRYQLIKARPVAGDLQSGSELLARLRPFIYRRYLDFNMLDALRKLKRSIDQDQADSADVEAGSGGLREVEFVVRALQLVRGGRNPGLQTESLTAALTALADIGGLSASTCKSLRDAHSYLLSVSNRLQGRTGTDTYLLPEDDAARASLMEAMDYASWTAFMYQLEVHRSFVKGEFRDLFASAQPEDSAAEQWRDIWEMAISPQHAQAQLSLRGFVDSAEAIRLIEQLRTGPLRQGMSERSAQRLDQFMPAMLAACNQTDDPDGSLQRIFGLLKAIRGRSTYIALLAERPAVLGELVALFQAGPWIARELTRYPVLLDDVLDPRSVLDISTPAALDKSLIAELRAAPTRDLEAEMDALRRFRRSATLQIARRRLSNEHTVQETAHSLGLVAECIVRSALDIAWRDIREATDTEHPPIAVIGYGSLGACELAFGSALDLVFLCPDNADPALSARSAQRLIHILTAVTSTGRLFAVNCSMRPHGDAGSLVSQISTFREFQTQKAATREAQALLRARFVAGDPSLAEEFERIRGQALSVDREPSHLCADMAASRAERMATAPPAPPDRFNLIHSPGGLLDILYLTHYLVLADAQSELIEARNTSTLLSAMGAHSARRADSSSCLLQAYEFYTARIQRATLAEQSMELPLSEVQPHARAVRKIWAETIARV